MSQEARAIAVSVEPPVQAVDTFAPSRSRTIRLSHGTVTLLVAPVTVLATALIACLLLSAANLPIHPAEMIAGGIINTLGGLLAGGALWMMLSRGTAGIAQAGILGIGLRCGTVLMGLLLASMGPLGLHRETLVYWVMGYYFPMLIVESLLVAWLSNRLPD